MEGHLLRSPLPHPTWEPTLAFKLPLLLPRRSPIVLGERLRIRQPTLGVLPMKLLQEPTLTASLLATEVILPIRIQAPSTDSCGEAKCQQGLAGERVSRIEERNLPAHHHIGLDHFTGLL